MTTTRPCLVLLAAYSIAAGLAQAADEAKPLYRDATQPIEKRVEDLLGRMTLEEKVGQMNMPCVYVGQLGRTIAEKTEGVQKFAAGTFLKGFGPGGGFFTLPNNILLEGTKQQAEFLNQLQKIALDQTRLGIPLLETEEGTHGLMCSGATSFPEGPSLGSTWNTELIGRIYAAVAKESRSIGIHQNFTLVVEPIRDPRLGAMKRPSAKTPTCARRSPEPSRGRCRATTFRPTTTSWPGCATIRVKASRSAAWNAGPWRSPNACCVKYFCPRGKRASRRMGPWA